MRDFTDALYTAAALIIHSDAELREIVFLSLAVSLTASICAFVIGSPVGTALAMYRFRGRGALIVVANALLGLPPVVVGLVVYLLLSRSGPLGMFEYPVHANCDGDRANPARHSNCRCACASDDG